MNHLNHASEEMCLERMEHYVNRMWNCIEDSSEFSFCLDQYNHWEWMLTKHQLAALLNDVNENQPVTIAL